MTMLKIKNPNDRVEYGFPDNRVELIGYYFIIIFKFEIPNDKVKTENF